MTDKVVPFPQPKQHSYDMTPLEAGEWLSRIVTLPDDRRKVYGELNFEEHTAYVAAEAAEYAGIKRRADAGDPEALAKLADPGHR